MQQELVEDRSIGMFWLQCVYVIPARDLVKVGVTTDIRSRMCSFRCDNPWIEAPFYVTEKLRNASRVEWLAHTELRAYSFTERRGPGREWFRCSPEIAADVVKRLVAERPSQSR